MLWNGGQTLVQEMLEAAMIRPDDKLPRLEIRPPMTHGLHETDEFALVGRQLGMLRGDRAAEESDRAVALMKHSTKPRAGSVAVDDEGLVEIRQLENRRCRERLFERVEGLRRCR